MRISRFFITIFVFSALPFFGFSQTTKEIKKLQSESSALKKNIEEQEKLLKSTKKDVKSQLNNLMLINSQITEQQKYVDRISVEVNDMATNISQLEKERNILNADLEKCKARYRKALAYLYRNRTPQNNVRIILLSKSYTQMRRRMRYVQQFSKIQRAQGEEIKHKEALLHEKENELRTAKSEKDVLLNEGRVQQTKLEGQKKERQNTVAQLNKKEKELNNTIRQQRQKQANLDAKIDRLIKIEIEKAEKRRREEAARKERERKERERLAAKNKAAAKNSKSGTTTKSPEPSKPTYRAADDADYKLAGSFAANRGRLPVPITGGYMITRHFGQNDVGGLKNVQIDNKGINITGQRGAQARCVFEGEVTAIFDVGGMWNIIVRHGTYMSVYCNLKSVSVKKGQKVSARQTLGAVATDASGNCTLHFQLRDSKTNKLNPEQWISR